MFFFPHASLPQYITVPEVKNLVQTRIEPIGLKFSVLTRIDKKIKKFDYIKIVMRIETNFGVGPSNEMIFQGKISDGSVTWRQELFLKTPNSNTPFCVKLFVDDVVLKCRGKEVVRRKTAAIDSKPRLLLFPRKAIKNLS